MTEHYDDEPECMKELRKIRERISAEISGMSGEEMQAYFKGHVEELERETGMKFRSGDRSSR